MSTPEKRSYTDPNTVYPRKDYHAQNKVHIPMPPRSIDKLLEQTPSMASMWLAEQDALVEALREARALLEKITSAGYLGEPDDRMLPHVAASLTLLEKWRGAS